MEEIEVSGETKVIRWFDYLDIKNVKKYDGLSKVIRDSIRSRLTSAITDKYHKEIAAVTNNCVKGRFRFVDGLYVNRDSNFYSSNVIINGNSVPIKLSRTRMNKLMGFLEEDGYIEQFYGYHVQEEAVNGYFLFTNKFKDELDKFVHLVRIKDTLPQNVILMRDGSKKNVEVTFKQTKEVKDMITEVNGYNEFMAKHKVELNGKEIPIELRRCFSRSSFECGGRFFAIGKSYQQLPGDVRKQLKIDGKGVCEVDFHCLHPSILYAKQGVDMLNTGLDPYMLSPDPDGFEPFKFHPALDMDCQEDLNRANKSMRNICKKALLIAINAKNRGEAERALRQDVYKGKAVKDEYWPVVSVNAKEVMEGIRRTNHAIEDSFFSDAGIHLQNIDAEIIAIVLKQCIHKTIPALPVHDSIVTPKEFAMDVSAIMIDAYEIVLDTNMNAKVNAK